MKSSLARWHEMAASRDLSQVGEIAREDVLFRSPVAHAPYQGREALTLVLTTVIRVCLLYTSPSPRDQRGSRMPSSA